MSAFLSLNSLGALVLGYLLGSIPFGLLLTRFAGLGDIRDIGSHSIGATNVLRTGRKGLAAATLLLDALKGTAAVLIAALWGPPAAIAAGLGAFLGHCFPVWLGFKGGKGFATYLGVLLALYWPAVIVLAVVWRGMAAIFRFSSLAALTASIVVPIALFLFGQTGAAVLYVVLLPLLWLRHHENIRRLLAGTETRIGEKKA
jgi:glycerol-3-phosphate acyltransferase PlsY